MQLSFEDQYAGRNGLWRVQSVLSGMVVYSGQTIHCDGLAMRVIGCFKGKNKVVSGVIHAGTKVAFRSRSAHVMLMIQLSREMWETDNDGLCYVENVVSGVLNDLFQKWTNHNITHSVTIVLFSRTWFDYDPEVVQYFCSEHSADNEDESVSFDKQTRFHYFPRSITQEEVENLTIHSNNDSDAQNALKQLTKPGQPSCFDLYDDIFNGERSLALDERGRVYEDLYMVRLRGFVIGLKVFVFVNVVW